MRKHTLKSQPLLESSKRYIWTHEVKYNPQWDWYKLSFVKTIIFGGFFWQFLPISLHPCGAFRGTGLQDCSRDCRPVPVPSYVGSRVSGCLPPITCPWQPMRVMQPFFLGLPSSDTKLPMGRTPGGNHSHGNEAERLGWLLDLCCLVESSCFSTLRSKSFWFLKRMNQRERERQHWSRWGGKWVFSCHCRFSCHQWLPCSALVYNILYYIHPS